MVIIPNENKPFPRVGQCIYCDATAYSPSREKLGKEHIIPLGLSGDLILPESACDCCERKINLFERPIMRELMGPTRYALGLKSRNIKDRPESDFRDIERVDGTRERISVPFESTPATLLLPRFTLPKILLEVQGDEDQDFDLKQWEHRIILPYDDGKWATENGIEAIKPISASMQADHWARLIAKIAHSFAVARLPAEREKFTLLNAVILNRGNVAPSAYLIGCFEGLEEPSTHLHEVKLARYHSPTHEIIVGAVRLFARFGMPTYCAAVSKVLLPEVE